MKDVTAFVLAGGEGSRLRPLAIHRAKPAVPFGGSYRVIDFVLSNLANSGAERVNVLAQYQSRSLDNHLIRGWGLRFGVSEDRYLRILHATQGVENGWYTGTADAIAQNMAYINGRRDKETMVFGSDHIYFMDVEQMLQEHRNNGASATISAIPVPIEQAANNFGVCVIDSKGRLIGFEEKPSRPTPIPGNEGLCLASMGNYVFNTPALLEELALDAKKTQGKKDQVRADPNLFTTRDFAFDVIPSLLRQGRPVFVYDFSKNVVPGSTEEERAFWRDVGTIKTYYDTSIDVCGISPALNIHNDLWPINSYIRFPRPAKANGKVVQNSLLGNGVIVTDSSVLWSVLHEITQVEHSKLERAILLGHTLVNPGCTIKNAIVDRGNNIPAGTVIGVDKEEDRARGFTVVDDITVVPRHFWRRDY